MFEDDKTVERENANWRIRQDGLGVELIRRAELSEVNELIEALFVHIAMVDIVALKKALRLREKGPQNGGTATLVEAFFSMFQDELRKAPRNCSCHCAASSAEHKATSSAGARKPSA